MTPLAISERPRVAVVTRTRNRPLMLRRAAISIQNQTFTDLAWLVINDGGDPEAVEKVLSDQPCLRYERTVIHNPSSQGMEAASNSGIRATDSDYIVIHDDDDTWEPEFLERCVGFLDADVAERYAGVVTHSTYVSERISATGIMVERTWPFNRSLQHIALPELAAGNLFPPISFLFRRSVYDQAGGFDESLEVLGDWDFNLRALSIADIGVIPELLANYHHRQHLDCEHPYANTVVAGRSEHQRVNAEIRNRLARGKHGISKELAFFGYALSELRREIRSGNLLPPPSQNAESDTDALWVSLSTLATRRYRWGVRSIVRSILRFMGLRRANPKPSDPTSILEFARSIVAQADLASIPAPADFDESAYLRQNGDVAVAIGKGQYSSGYHHYLVCGRKEGRMRPAFSSHCDSSSGASVDPFGLHHMSTSDESE